LYFSHFSGISGIFYFILESLVSRYQFLKFQKNVGVEKFWVYMGQGDVPYETL
jgi:hypothetical protein